MYTSAIMAGKTSRTCTCRGFPHSHGPLSHSYDVKPVYNRRHRCQWVAVEISNARLVTEMYKS